MATTKITSNSLALNAAQNNINSGTSFISNVPTTINNSLFIASNLTTAKILATSGTVASPAYSFSSDPTTGLFRFSAGRVVMACGGVSIADFSGSGIILTNGVYKVIGGGVTLNSFCKSGDENTGINFPAADNLGLAAGGINRVVITSTGVTFTVPITAPNINGDTTFANNIIGNGADNTLPNQLASSGGSVMTRDLVRKEPLAFYRPLESTIRFRADYFMRGSLTPGDIGEWGWDRSLTGSAYLGFGGGNRTASPSGRCIMLLTGATSGSIARMFLAQAQTNIWQAIASTFHFATFSPGQANSSILVDGAAWVGYSDQNLDTGGQYLLFGWDTAMSANYLIRYKNGVSETVIDTGVSRRLGDFSEVRHSVTIVGGNFDSIGSRIIVTTSINGSTSPDTFTTAIPFVNIFNHRYLAIAKNNAAIDKYLGLSGLEIRHKSPNIYH